MQDRPWFQHYDEGVPRHIDYPQAPVFHFLEESARKYPDRPCTIFKGATLSFREINELSDRLAAGLYKLGVRKGDRVGIFMPNTPQFVIAYFAILKIGGVVVATNPLYTPREIIHQVNDAGIQYMVVMSNYYERIKAVQGQTGIKQLVVTNIKETLPPLLRVLFTLTKEKKGGFRVTLRDNDVYMWDLIAQHGPEERPQIDVGPDDVALFQYTGGTTGTSKGAIALHRNLVANALQIRYWMPNLEEGNEVLLMALPLFHVYGMVAGMLFAMATGSSMVMLPDPRDIPEILK
ncbi:long-chain fatty acid--CoA ligase, partial [Candidatus Parcubacteria bacterium]